MMAGLENTGGSEKTAALGQRQTRAARILPEHVKAAARGPLQRRNVDLLARKNLAP
jgi:hypothetical protein